jgi:multidrug transporter EmrE-like cation transporter
MSIRFFDFGGKTLMKWREPNTRSRKFIWLLYFIGWLFFMIVLASKFNDKSVKYSPLPLMFIVFTCYFIIVFFMIPSVRLTELCVQRREGKFRRRSNYDKIESATVGKQNFFDQKVTVIEFKLKNKPPFFPDTSIGAVRVPDDVNLEQVLQILRDKGIKVFERH